MSKYIDGFILVVPRGREDEYKKMAEEGRDTWMKHGALGYYECRGDDLKPQEWGEERSRSFPEIAAANDNENVWFSFIVFNSKQHRDEVNKKVVDEMAGSYGEPSEDAMPFDMRRMAYGGFEVAVEG